jgi:hypothetical protein
LAFACPEFTTEEDMTTGQSDASGGGDNEQSTVQQVTGQAQEKAQQLAGQAQERAQQAAGQASVRLRDQIDQRSSQAADQISTHASDLRSVSDSLREQGKQGPADMAGRLAEQADKVGGYLRDRDSDGLLADAEDFGRRQPWAVAAGGVVLGFAAARFLKASSSRRYASRMGSSGDGQAVEGPRPASIGATSPALGTGAIPPVPATPSMPATPGAFPPSTAPGEQPPIDPAPARTTGP